MVIKLVIPERDNDKDEQKDHDLVEKTTSAKIGAK